MEEIQEEVENLLAAKKSFKIFSRVDWKPDLEFFTEVIYPGGVLGRGIAEIYGPPFDPPFVGGKSKEAKKAILDHLNVAINEVARDYFKRKANPHIDANVTALGLNELIRVDQVEVDELRATGRRDALMQIRAASWALNNRKASFKDLCGVEWKPNVVIPRFPDLSSDSDTEDADMTYELVVEQADKIRRLTAQNVSKEVLDPEIKILLALKGQYKDYSGKDWKPPPEAVQQTFKKPEMATKNTVEDLEAQIIKQGDSVRELKNKSGSKADIEQAVKLLLELKAKYKEATGKDWQPVGGGGGGGGARPKKESKPKQSQQPKKEKAKEKSEQEDGAGGLKKQTRLGLEAKKEQNLSDWYSQVITKGEMIEYYDVSGCYILRPWSYAIWEAIQRWFDAEIKKMGVQNAYFPIFVSRSVLEKEKTHIADFAPEVAWVTKSGETDLAEPIAVRPTSETVMYPAYAKWVQSYRDLPIKLNQWNNVVRWEFKHPQPFLRTREFLWQEGHTAMANESDSKAEVYEILELYAEVYQGLLAIPVIKGHKTEKEKFAGGDFTTTVEAFVSASGRGIQGATSHHLGQNFSKMFDIVFDDPDTQEKKFVYQNSWGITTRTIGVMVMIHADNKGLVLPPKVACIQVVIVPCGITASMKDDERFALLASCKSLEDTLVDVGVKVKGDYRDNYSPGWKFNHWELKGVPIRIELGPKDVKQGQFVAVRRDTGEKVMMPRSSAGDDVLALLDNIQTSMFAKASAEMKDHTKRCKTWDEFCQHLDGKNIILAPFCGDIPCEDKIKQDSARDDPEAEAGAPAMGAKGLCIPFDQACPIEANDKCIHPSCNKKPKFYTLFGRSY